MKETYNVNYNVRILVSTNGGKTWTYSDNGKFFETEAEALDFAKAALTA